MITAHIQDGGGPFSSLWLPVYVSCSAKPLPSVIKVPIPKLVAPFVELLSKADGLKKSPKIVDEMLSGLLWGGWCEPSTYTGDKKAVYLAYSGGKDSVAAAIKLQQDGFNVTACFVTGVNRSVPQELEYARKSTKILGIPLRVIPFKVSGRSDRPENPAKNIITIALMADIGFRYGVTKYAIGTDAGDDQESISSMFNFSDGPETLDACLPSFRKWIPKFQLMREVLHSDSFTTVLGHPEAKKLIPAICSCQAPFRFMEKWRRDNAEKYGVDMLPGRCGSCIKCAVEAIHLAGYGFQKPNKRYLAHAWEILSRLGPRVILIPGKKPGACLSREEVKEYLIDEQLHNAICLK